MLAQETKLRGIAEEARFGDGDEVEQVAELRLDDARRFAAQTLEIFVVALQAELLHARRDGGRQRGSLAGVETKSAALLDEVPDGGERS